MTGRGVSYGAISVLNAIPCGFGSTIGVDLRTEAVFEPTDGPIEVKLVDRPKMSDRLVRYCVRETLAAIAENPAGYDLMVTSQIPPSRGLKSSSSACNAVISAVLDHYGVDMDPVDVVRLGVECAIHCKVTITGAFDDACGCHLGGLVVTDNFEKKVLSRKEIEKYDVIICSPEREITKDKVDVSAYRALAEKYLQLAHSAEADPLGVLIENGKAVAGIIGMDDSIVKRAMDLGALAGGVSGTGPAVSIVCEPGTGKAIAEQLGCETILCRVR